MSNELYHYGVKGMRWGVRRYQNKNGSLTNAGKKRYKNDSETNNEKSSGLSDKQKTALKVGVVAATSALLVLGAYKISNSRNMDRVIKAGKDFYRQGHENESVEGLNELVYASFKKQDFKKYKSIANDEKSYIIRNDNKVKVAGIKNAKRIYNELLATNKEFNSHYGKMSYEDFNGMLGFVNPTLIEQNKLLNKTLKDTYMAPFFEALRAKGYNAVVDTQDKFAKIPVILLNSANEYKIKT